MKCRGLGSEVPLQARSRSQVRSSGKLCNLMTFALSHLNNGALGQIDDKNDSDSPLSRIQPMTMGFCSSFHAMVASTSLPLDSGLALRFASPQRMWYKRLVP